MFTRYIPVTVPSSTGGSPLIIPSSSSSGTNNNNNGDGDGDGDGNGMDALKSVLLVVMIIAGCILFLAGIAWLISWYISYRRGVVSREGAAGINVRQVLLE